MVPPLFLCATSILLTYRRNVVPVESSTHFDAYLEGGSPPYRHRKYFWDHNAETSCFRLDSICHRNDTWFYRRSGRTGSHQPTITYVQDNVTFSHGYIKVDPRIYFNVSASSVATTDHDSCPIHPIPFHMIVQSAYNDMMGEFYSRSLVALNQVLLSFLFHLLFLLSSCSNLHFEPFLFSFYTTTPFLAATTQIFKCIFTSWKKTNKTSLKDTVYSLVVYPTIISSILSSRYYQIKHVIASKS